MRTPSILLIDDEGIVRGALKAVLSQRGYDVRTASSGPEGLRMLEEAPPDLVILDREMPVMTGSDVLRRIRKIRPEIPVIVLTGWADDDGEKKYKFLGAAMFLSKDLEMESLIGAVETLVPLAVKGAGAESGDRILVADDDDVIRRLLQRFLEGKGYQVLAVSGGQAALDALPRFAPKIILLDLDMPGMRGREVLRHLQKIPKRPGVIMITGNEDVEIARACLKEGADDYVTKPFSLENLETSIWAKIMTLEP